MQPNRILILNHLPESTHWATMITSSNATSRNATTINAPKNARAKNKAPS
jgi:hypothetical protein